MTDTFECSQYGSHPVGPQDTVILPGDTFRKMHFDLAERDATIRQLRDALDQLLDDMGETGLSVCQAAKDFARETLEKCK